MSSFFFFGFAGPHLVLGRSEKQTNKASATTTRAQSTAWVANGRWLNAGTAHDADGVFYFWGGPCENRCRPIDRAGRRYRRCVFRATERPFLDTPQRHGGGPKHLKVRLLIFYRRRRRRRRRRRGEPRKKSKADSDERVEQLDEASNARDVVSLWEPADRRANLATPGRRRSLAGPRSNSIGRQRKGERGGGGFIELPRCCFLFRTGFRQVTTLESFVFFFRSRTERHRRRF